MTRRLRGKSFFEVFGFRGLALLASFFLSAAILIALVVNGVNVYLYSAKLRRDGTTWYDERHVDSPKDSGYDYSMANWSHWDRVVYDGLSDDEGWAARALDASDFFFSDNYEAEQYWRLYVHDHDEVVVGIALTACMAAVYVWQCWRGRRAGPSFPRRRDERIVLPTVDAGSPCRLTVASTPSIPA